MIVVQHEIIVVDAYKVVYSSYNQFGVYKYNVLILILLFMESLFWTV